MLEFLRPIVIFDVWIYILLGLVALFFIRVMVMAQKDRSRSIFTLERENANARFARAFLGLMIVLGLILGVYYLSAITPTLVPPTQITPTPTDIIELPDTPTPPPLFTATPTASATPPPTAAITFDETPLPPPPPPPAAQGQPPSCPNPGSVITRPGNGAQISGVIQVSGSAITENFDYYKFEFRVPGNEEWSFIERYNNAVQGGVLGSWNSDTVAPGEYEFRLVVVDNIGNFPEPCVVRLLVQ